MIASKCPSVDQLSEFAKGISSEDTAEEVVSHLDNCSECENTVDNLDLKADTMVSLLKAETPADPYAEESGARRMEELVRQIGHDISVSLTPDQALQIESIGQYRIIKKIGEGGMGAIYKAVHQKLEKVVALKVLPAARLSNEMAVSRFEREMKAVGKLDHPNIVRATDAGEIDGSHFLVMELVNGPDVSEVCRTLGQIPVAGACEVVRQAAAGLQEAHEANMVHRDIKPSNIMIARTRRGPVVKVLDLGLALLNDPAGGDDLELTTAGSVMGTLHYMAPEQGSDSHDVDARADIYALGATLFRMLTGETPFSNVKYNTPIKLLSALSTQETRSIGSLRPDLPAELIAIVDRMLTSSPADRIATAGEVVSMLAPFANGADLQLLIDANPDAAAIRPESEIDQTAETSTQSLVASRTNSYVETPASSAPAVKTQLKPSRAKTSNKRWLIASAVTAIGLLAIVAYGIVMMFQIGDATIIVESEDPELRVFLKNDEITIEDQKSKQGYKVAVAPGGHKLRIVKGDTEFTTETFQVSQNQKVHFKISLAAKQLKVQRDGKGVVVNGQTANETVASKTPAKSVTPPEAVASLTSDADRKAVQRVHLLGGTVTARTTSGDSIPIRRGDAIPQDMEQLSFIVGDRNGADAVNDEDMKTLACPSLTAFTLRIPGMTDRGAAELKKCKKLFLLLISDSEMTDEGLVAIASINSLGTLSIDTSTPSEQAEKFTASGLRQLSKLSNLYSFSVGVSELREEHLQAISLLEVVSYLHLIVRDSVKAESLDSLNPLQERLISARLTGDGVRPQHLEWLAGCSVLKWISFYKNDLSGVDLSFIGRRSSIKEASIAFSDLSDQQLKDIAKSKSITTIEFRSSNIRNEGLAELQAMPSLAKLIMTSNLQITDDAIPYLSKLKLDTLSLNSTGISAAGVVKLRKQMPKTKVTSSHSEAELKATSNGIAP